MAELFRLVKYDNFPMADLSLYNPLTIMELHPYRDSKQGHHGPPAYLHDLMGKHILGFHKWWYPQVRSMVSFWEIPIVNNFGENYKFP